MFPFDQSALPQLTTRKALIGIDFQNDFVTPNGALSVAEPEALVDRTVKLASFFRKHGEVVWVQSQFVAPRPADGEQICTSDAPPPSRQRPSSRGRRTKSVEPVIEAGPPDIEAFLSHPEPGCIKAGTPGCDLVSAIRDTSSNRDMMLTKSYYSAFNTTQLLIALRSKFVMELFICGSLTNVGVYATALDAAGHGMAITIVEDCCGSRSDARQTRAIQSLIELTGCEVASSAEVFESLEPKPKRQPKTPTKSADKNTKSKSRGETDRESLTPEYVKAVAGMRLGSDSPTPARTQPEPQTQATKPEAGGVVNTSSDKSSQDGALNASTTALEPDLPTSKMTKIEETPNTPKENGSHSVEDGKVNQKSLDVNETKNFDVDDSLDAIGAPGKSTEALEGEPVVDKKPEPVDIDAQTKNDTEAADVDGDECQLRQRGLCEGDTDVIEDILPESLAEGIFDKLREEVHWQRMSHQGGEVPRLVAVQGELAEDGSMPVYRHPSDESPPLLAFSPTVFAIKEETEKQLGHPLNHVLIQYYRDGTDYISEHSDKTLDIVKGSYIANVSLGAERTMVLRTKRLDKDHTRTEPLPTDAKRKIQRARLPHNSLCRMGLQTNMKWLHAIRQDKRAERDKTAAELAYEGGRISLTFRQIGTFLDKDESLIWGQGATGKTREDAHQVINGQSADSVAMLKAFGTENHSSNFDWDAYYGKGFDVLHMTSSPRLFVSSDAVANMRCSLMLADCGISFAKGSMGSVAPAKDSSVDVGDHSIKFIDNDPSRATVQGDAAIMLYLDSQYGQGKKEPARTPAELATQFTRFQQGLILLEKWRKLRKSIEDTDKNALSSLKRELTFWDAFAGESEGWFLAGSTPSLPDYAVWPVLHTIVKSVGLESLAGLNSLSKYYKMYAEQTSTKKVLEREAGAEAGA